MRIILSPSKTIEQSGKRVIGNFSTPYFADEAAMLAKSLSKLDKNKLADVLECSSRIAELTYDRYQFWNKDHNVKNAKQAILSFKGDVFTGLNAEVFSDSDLIYANKHLLILSGLYGILQPLDLIQPYRLEIATKLKVKGHGDLYSYWKEKITKRLIRLLEEDTEPVLINLASNEYTRAIDIKKIKFPIITPVFKENKGGTYKVVSIYAKRARGLLTSYILRNRINDPEEIKLFSEEGYYYNNSLSVPHEVVFTRG